MPFNTLKESLAGISNGTLSLEVAGFILGAIVVALLFVGFTLIFSGKRGSEQSSYFGFFIGAIFVSLVQWWPIWTLFLLALAIVYLMVFKEDRGK